MSISWDTEKGERALRPADSNVTLTNANTTANTTASVSPESSATSTPYMSRNSSTEQLRTVSMRVLSKSSKHTHRFLSQELDQSWMGTVVVICFFTSGLIDSVAFNTWNCFVGMQTGNTVFAALGLGGQPETNHFQQYYKSLVSIGAFCLGALFFNAIHRYPTGLSNQPSSRRRWIFVLSFLLQTIFIVIAAAVVSLHLVSDKPFKPGTFSSGNEAQAPESTTRTNFFDLAPIAFLAFQAAGQCCLSRVLALIELPTIVLSTLFHDFVADLYGTRLAWRNSESFSDFIFGSYRRQEKRLVAILALFVGAVVGSEMFKSRAGMAGALWMAAGLKLAISLALLAWKKDESEDETLPR